MTIQTWVPGQAPITKPKLNPLRFNPEATEFKPIAIVPNSIDNELSKYVAIDVEHTPVVEGGSWPTQVSIVDENLNTLLNEYILMERRPRVTPKQQRAKNNRRFQRTRKPYAEVKPMIERILHNKIVVGHDLAHDFKTLDLDINAYKTIDTAKLPLFMQRQNILKPKSLRNLTKRYLDRTIQGGIHDSLVDADATMRVFLTFKDKEQYTFPYTHENIKMSKKILKEAKEYGLHDENSIRPSLADNANLIQFPKPVAPVNYTANLEQVFPPNPRGQLITKYMANIPIETNLLRLNTPPPRNTTRRYRYETNLEGLFPAKPKPKTTWQKMKNMFTRRKTRRRNNWVNNLTISRIDVIRR